MQKWTKLLPSLVAFLMLAGNFTASTFIFAQQNRPAPGEVNIEYSRIFIFVDKSGLVGHQHGVEGKLASSQLFLTSTPEKPGTLVFDMTSFEADTTMARKYFKMEGELDSKTRDQVNANMRGAEILNVNKFPKAQLDRIEIVAKTSAPNDQTANAPVVKDQGDKVRKKEFIMKGDFTLCGRTRPIEVPIQLENQDGWYHIQGAFKILQSDYGIKPYSKMLGTVGVTDQLVIYGDLWVVPE